MRVERLGLELAYGLLTCLGRHTITGMLSTRGKQFVDWTSAYRLFGKNRVDIDKLFGVARQDVLEQLPAGNMIIAHMDDTIIRKVGKKIPGVSWRRDPLGPAFHTNFVWGQRFIQISMALPEENLNSRSRAIPIDFHHCPTVKRLEKEADQEQVKLFQEQKKQQKLSRQGAFRIALLRKQLDQQAAQDKTLYIGVDGSYTNGTVLKSLPQRTVLIGRIRKDTKLYKFPAQANQTGRKKRTGIDCPPLNRSGSKIRPPGNRYRHGQLASRMILTSK